MPTTPERVIVHVSTPKRRFQMLRKLKIPAVKRFEHCVGKMSALAASLSLDVGTPNTAKKLVPDIFLEVPPGQRSAGHTLMGVARGRVTTASALSARRCG